MAKIVSALRQQTFRLLAYRLRENGLGIALGAAVLAAVLAVFAYWSVRQGSPMVSSSQMMGRIVSIAVSPDDSDPEVSTGIARFNYLIELDGGLGMVLAWDKIDRPHRIGESVTIVRSARANGVVTARFKP